LRPWQNERPNPGSSQEGSGKNLKKGGQGRGVKGTAWGTKNKHRANSLRKKEETTKQRKKLGCSVSLVRTNHEAN